MSALATGIRRDSPIPFYFQLSELLEQEITSGHWKAGFRLPSEPELCRLFNLSRTTVRQALGRLEQEGLIERSKGQGTFVCESRPRSWLLQSSGGFFQEEVERGGRLVTSVVLRSDTSGELPPGRPPPSNGPRAPRWSGSARSTGSSRCTTSITCLRAIAELVLPLEDPNQSLYQRLKDVVGIEAAGGRRVVEAVRAEERLARVLELPMGSPVLFIESVTWDRDLRPFDCYQSWLRTDRMRIDVQVASSPVTASTFATPAFTGGRG